MTDDDLVVLLFPRLDLPEPEPSEAVTRAQSGYTRIPPSFWEGDFAEVEARSVAQLEPLLHLNLSAEQVTEIRENVRRYMECLRERTSLSFVSSFLAFEEAINDPRTWAGVGQAFRGLSGLLHDAEAAVPSEIAEAFREVDPTAYRDDLTSHLIEDPGLVEIRAERVQARRLTNMIRDVLDEGLGPDREFTVCYGHSKRYDYLDNVPMAEPIRDPGGDEIRGRVHRPSIAAQERRDRSRFANYSAKSLPKSGVREYRRRRR